MINNRIFDCLIIVNTPSAAHPNYTYLAIPPCPMSGECYTLNDTFTWTNGLAAKEAHCSKSNVKTIMRKLEKFGAIRCIQKGQSGSFTRSSNLYRKEI